METRVFCAPRGPATWTKCSSTSREAPTSTHPTRSVLHSFVSSRTLIERLINAFGVKCISDSSSCRVFLLPPRVPLSPPSSLVNRNTCSGCQTQMFLFLAKPLNFCSSHPTPVCKRTKASSVTPNATANVTKSFLPDERNPKLKHCHQCSVQIRAC